MLACYIRIPRTNNLEYIDTLSGYNRLHLLYNFYLINNYCLFYLIIRFITNNFLHNLSKQLLDLSSGKTRKKERILYLYIHNKRHIKQISIFNKNNGKIDFDKHKI